MGGRVSDTFVPRCFHALMVGLAFGFTPLPLWVSLPVALAVNASTTWFCTTEYERGWTEHADRVETILKDFGKRLDNPSQP